MRKHKLILIILLVFTTGVQAQQCDKILLGEVVDFHDGLPLFGAVVTIEGKEQKTTTDFNGKFTLKGLCEGPVTVLISHHDCEDISVEVIIEGDTFQKFRMEHHLEELGEVVVTESRIIRETNSAQEQLIQGEAIEKFSGRSLGDALKEISGVSSLNTGNTIVKPVIQGLHSSRVIIMNNGVRMQDQEWGSEHAPNLDLNSISRLSVVKGSAALKYGGDAVGGIIIASPERVALQDTIYGRTLLTGATNGRGGALSSTLVKGYRSGWNFKVQGSLKRFGDFETPDYVLSNTGVAESGITGSLGYRSLGFGFEAFYSYYHNEIGILRASHIGNLNDLERALQSDVPLIIRDHTYDILAPKQKVDHHLAKIDMYKRLEGLGRWNLQYDFQRNNRLEFDIRRGEENDNLPSLDLTLTTHTLNTDFEFDALPGFTMNTGIKALYQNNFPDPATKVKRLIPDYDRWDLGGFLTGDYHLSDAWLLEAGVRYDFSRMDAKKFYDDADWEEQGYDILYPEFELEDAGTQILVNPVLDYHNFSAIVGGKYTKGDYQLLINYALASRAPNPAELFSDGLHHSAAAIETGALNLDSETSHKISLTFGKVNGDFQYSLAPFASRINGFIFLKPDDLELTVRGAFPVWVYQQTDAHMIGADLDASWRVSPVWSTSHKFSFVYGEDLDQDIPLIDIPSANFSNRVTYQKKEAYDLNINLRSDYVFEQTNFPDNSFPYEKLENGEVVTTTIDLSTPPPAYHLLGMDVSMQFDLGASTAMQVTLIGNNLLDKEYRDYLNRQRFYADDLGRNIQLQLKISY